MPFGETREDLVDALLVAAVLTIAGLSELVGVPGTFDAVADVGVGMIT